MEGLKKDIGEYSDEYISNYVNELGHHTTEPYFHVPKWEYRELVARSTRLEILEGRVRSNVEAGTKISMECLIEILDIPAEAVVEE